MDDKPLSPSLTDPAFSPNVFGSNVGGTEIPPPVCDSEWRCQSIVDERAELLQRVADLEAEVQRLRSMGHTD